MTNNNDTKRAFLSPPQLGKRWGFNPATIIKLCRFGQLPHLRLGSARKRRYLIARADVERIENEGLPKPEPVEPAV